MRIFFLICFFGVCQTEVRAQSPSVIYNDSAQLIKAFLDSSVILHKTILSWNEDDALKLRQILFHSLYESIDRRFKSYNLDSLEIDYKLNILVNDITKYEWGTFDIEKKQRSMATKALRRNSNRKTNGKSARSLISISQPIYLNNFKYALLRYQCKNGMKYNCKSGYILFEYRETKWEAAYIHGKDCSGWYKRY